MWAGTSLEAQWKRICLPMQGTQVQSPVGEDCTYCGKTRPKSWNYWACELHSWSPHTQSLGSTREATAMSSLRTARKSLPHFPQPEKVHAKQQRPSAAKDKNEKRHLRAEHTADCQKKMTNINSMKILNFWSLCVCVCVLSCVHLFATPWTIARQALLSVGFPRQEYWSGLPFPSPGDLPNAGTEPLFPVSPAVAGRLLVHTNCSTPIIFVHVCLQRYMQMSLSALSWIKVSR